MCQTPFRVCLSASDDEILPAVALGMFAGLRPESEIWRLDWSKIDFTRKQIDVEPLATKNNGDNASVRWVEMPDNLIEWLLPFRRKAGPVSPTGDSYFSAFSEPEKAPKSSRGHTTRCDTAFAHTTMRRTMTPERRWLRPATQIHAHFSATTGHECSGTMQSAFSQSGRPATAPGKKSFRFRRPEVTKEFL